MVGMDYNDALNDLCDPALKDSAFKVSLRDDGVWLGRGGLLAIFSQINIACQAITGCLKPTYVDIRRDVCHMAAKTTLKSRKHFLTNVKTIQLPCKSRTI